MPNRLDQILKSSDSIDLKSYDAYVAFFESSPTSKAWSAALPPRFDKEDRTLVLELSKRHDLKFEAGKFLSFDRQPLQRWLLVAIENKQSMFQLLELARQLVLALKAAAAKRILVDLRDVPQALALLVIDAMVAAQRSLAYKLPKYAAKDKEKEKEKGAGRLYFALPSRLEFDRAQGALEASDASTAAANQARTFIMQAGNDLTPKRYVQLIKDHASEEGLGFEFLSVKKLKTMGAGAFLAVAQGSTHEDAGIVKLSYVPQKKRGLKHLALVGKGITFDTGGTNLKSAAYMFGMHRDMAGSAVAYALIQLAAREKWPLQVSAYLAITDNSSGPNAYRQNDVVTALNGKTIEIVHTDAEGRMVLADTLHLAALEKPDLMLDFATLTGACVQAISTVYSGAFTNRPSFHSALIEAGRQSGERIWPFPLDPDFGESLKSDIADIKQCRLTGGVDHIEAAIFLQEFVGQQVPWVHIDLSAAENKGGLAHVETEVTGFGVRVGERVIRSLVLEGND